MKALGFESRPTTKFETASGLFLYPDIFLFVNLLGRTDLFVGDGDNLFCRCQY